MIITSFNILADTFVTNSKTFLNRWYPTLEYNELMMRNRFNTLIKYIKGDIIMLQEVTPHIRNKLYKLYKSKYDVLPLSCHKTKKNITGNLTMIKKHLCKENPIQQTFYINDNAIGLTTTEHIDIYNIHLHWSSSKKRKKELKKIISTFNKDKKIIIGGDFNSDNKELHDLLIKENFKINFPLKKGTYLCETPMIDYIYVYGFENPIGNVNNTITIDKSNSNPYRKTIKKYGSDHHPVTVCVKNNITKKRR
jgi:endonuclease/exonuclease/phosphatase (EEP) superfamily protein YafD